MPSLTRLIKLHGANTQFPKPISFKAGSLSMHYLNGAVRNIMTGDTELLRMIYAAVRDPHWITVEPEISIEDQDQNESGFCLGFNARYISEDIDFRARYSIRADSEQHFVFTMEGKAHNTFLRNRIGFCILHPVESCAGKECEIVHPDGTKSRLQFPADISPHQPFKNIASMRWMINERQFATLNFFGDVFETEDQRNWTDASYKTYSTPLDIHFPVEIQKGTVIKQRIELLISDGVTPISDGATLSHPVTNHRRPVTGGSRPVTIRIETRNSMPLPPIGTAVSSRPQPLSTAEANHLKNIRFSHLRSELHLFDPGFEIQYARLIHEARLLDLPAEICMVFGKEPEKWFQQFLISYRQNPLKIKSVLLLSQTERITSQQLLNDIMPVIIRELPGIPVGAGTNGNFAQLNRNRPDPAGIDFVSFAIHPQEHATDDQTIFENMEGQKYAILTAQKFKGSKPVHVSPVTLQRRFNANISNFEIPADHDSIPPQVDVRQMSLAGAAWTVGSLKYLLESGVASVTYYETVGERGLMMGDYSSRWPKNFPATAGMIFPVYHVFRVLQSDASYRIVPSKSNKPLIADSLVLVNDNFGILIISNMTGQDQEVEISGAMQLQTQLTLNETNFHQMIRPGFATPSSQETGDPVIYLLPYETRFIKFLI